MGGLISLYAATRNPDVFGAVLAESPTLILGNKDAVKELFATPNSWPRRVYLGVGGRELTGDERAREANQRLIEAVKGIDAAAAAAGAAHVVVVEPEATHDENAWARRFPEALKFLFPKPAK